jgi:hypothetical protein
MNKFTWRHTAVFLLIFSTVQGQTSKFSALFIINFAKYVIWPDSEASGDFTITVLGDDPVYEELKSLSADTKIGKQPIAVKKSTTLDKIDRCRILFISPDKSNMTPTALAKFPVNTLIVTEKEGLGKLGAAINLVMINGKLTFEINADGLKKSGLSAKPALFKLGKTM